MIPLTHKLVFTINAKIAKKKKGLSDDPKPLNKYW